MKITIFAGLVVLFYFVAGVMSEDVHDQGSVVLPPSVNLRYKSSRMFLRPDHWPQMIGSKQRRFESEINLQDLLSQIEAGSLPKQPLDKKSDEDNVYKNLFLGVRG